MAEICHCARMGATRSRKASAEMHFVTAVPLTPADQSRNRKSLDSIACPHHLEQMTAGLTLAKLIGPIAAATIVNVFLFAGFGAGINGAP